MARRRLDSELVRRGLAESRERARALITARRVLVNGAPADKPARLVDPGEAVHVEGPPARFVGRGGVKLAAALDAFDIDPAGWRVIDVGASTGGFTDCALQAGAARVVAIDVGRAQLHPRLVADARVDSRERTNIRHVDPADVGGPAPLVVADLSFISLRVVMDRLVALTEPDGHLVVLVKPQFEAGRAEVAPGRGVVGDPAVWRRVLLEVLEAARAAGATPHAIVPSPLRGGDGNVEFFVHLRRGRAGAVPPDVDQAIAEVTAATATGDDVTPSP